MIAPQSLEPTAVVGQFLMQTFTIEPMHAAFSSHSSAPIPLVLGTSLVLDLEAFPELSWLSAYLSYLHILQYEHDRLSCALESVIASGEVFRNCWIEPYTKTKQAKEYTYHQLRWLTGERKPSGQPKVKTKHLCHRAVGAVQAAIARGHQIEALEKQRRQVEEEMERLKLLMRATERRLQRVMPQHVKGEEGNSDAS